MALNEGRTTEEVECNDQLEHLKDNLPTMERQCRVAVLIPALLEKEDIYRAIEGYANQISLDGKEKIDPRLWEITILVNREEELEKDRTVQEALRAQQNFPDNRIFILELVFPSGGGGIGRVRRIMTDLTDIRVADVGINPSEFYIQSTDGDLKGVDNRLIARLIHQMDAQKDIGGLAGKIVFDPNIVTPIDTLLLKTRSADLLKRILDAERRGGGIDEDDYPIITHGANFGMRLKVYKNTEGYNRELKKGEDSALGLEIRRTRSRIERIQSIVVVSARRKVMPLINGSLDPTYKNFGDPMYEQQIRAMSSSEMLEKLKDLGEINEENIYILEFYLDTKFRKCISRLGHSNGLYIFKKMMKELGFQHNDYLINERERKITIIKLSNIKLALQAYRKRQWYQRWLKKQQEEIQKVA